MPSQRPTAATYCSSTSLGIARLTSRRPSVIWKVQRGINGFKSSSSRITQGCLDTRSPTSLSASLRPSGAMTSSRVMVATATFKLVSMTLHMMWKRSDMECPSSTYILLESILHRLTVWERLQAHIHLVKGWQGVSSIAGNLCRRFEADRYARTINLSLACQKNKK